MWVEIQGNLSHFQCLACWVVKLDYKCPFKVLFRCPHPLNRGVRLIKVSFKVNKGNKFGDFGYCPLNRRCPLNTGFTVMQNAVRTFFKISTQSVNRAMRRVVAKRLQPAKFAS